MPDVSPATLLAKLESLTARIEAQDTEIARLKAAAGSAAPGSEPVTGDRGGSGTSSRRDVLRLGGVALGAAAASLAGRPAEAADGNPLLAGSNNDATLSTRLSCTGSTNVDGFSSVCSAPTGINWGLRGEVASPAGGASGVRGLATAVTGVTYAMRGDNLSSMGFGVFGQVTAGGVAVQGQIPSTSSANAIALYGSNLSSYAGPSPGAGGFGVYGLSAKGHGLVGATASSGSAAVVGATNGVPGAYAATFYGPVVVGGDFTVVGGAKSAAVAHPDGTHRRLYCVESPESWFEDFGKGELACGQADVSFDPDFAAIVRLEDYHVFVTGYDDFELRVTARTPQGFRVEAKDTASTGHFSWRVVAKRKDIAGERLAAVEVPVEPTLPPMVEIVDDVRNGRRE